MTLLRRRDASMACGVRARAATSRLGYVWRKRKMVVSECAVQLLMVAVRFLQEDECQCVRAGDGWGNPPRTSAS